MRPTTPNKLLLLPLALVLAAGMAHAQSPGPYTPYRVDISGYKGNTVQSDSISITPSDTLQQLTAVAMYREGNDPVAALAPTLIRKKLKLVVRWTLTPPFTDGWYQVRSGGQTIRYGAVRITTQGIIPPQANGNTIAAIIAQLAQSFGAGKLDVGTFNTFVSANTIALGLKLNLADTTAFVRKYNGYRLMSNSEGVKLAGLPDGATYSGTITGINTAIGQKAPQSALDATNANVASVSASVGANTAAIVLASPRIFATYDAARIASLTATMPQTWVVTADETALVNGMPQKQTYWFDGSKLYYPILSPADGSPGTTSFNTAISDLNTTKAAKTEVYLDIEVGTYPDLQTWITANPTKSAIITVTVDINNANDEGVYRFRKGKLNEFFML